MTMHQLYSLNCSCTYHALDGFLAGCPGANDLLHVDPRSLIHLELFYHASQVLLCLAWFRQHPWIQEAHDVNLN